MSPLPVSPRGMYFEEFEEGQVIEKGKPLFSIKYSDFSLDIPSPLSGKITSVNSEHAEHPEWLSIKPFELSWMCGLDPSNLASELQGLKIGHDSVDWYHEEIDRYQALADKFIEKTAQLESDETKEGESLKKEEYKNLLMSFSKPFLQN